MKKTILLLFVLVLACSLVFATSQKGVLKIKESKAEISQDLQVSTETANQEQNEEEQDEDIEVIDIETDEYEPMPIPDPSSGGQSSDSGETPVSHKVKTRIRVKNILVNSYLNITKEKIKNRTRLKAILSNGKKAEIKVMPDVASERAIERLRLKVCSEENNCTIVLKEVALKRKANQTANETGLAYEIQARKQYKLFGFIRRRAAVKAYVNAETGEVISTKKPWWAFLAFE